MSEVKSEVTQAAVLVNERLLSGRVDAELWGALRSLAALPSEHVAASMVRARVLAVNKCKLHGEMEGIHAWLSAWLIQHEEQVRAWFVGVCSVGVRKLRTKRYGVDLGWYGADADALMLTLNLPGDDTERFVRQQSHLLWEFLRGEHGHGLSMTGGSRMSYWDACDGGDWVAAYESVKVQLQDWFSTLDMRGEACQAASDALMEVLGLPAQAADLWDRLKVGDMLLHSTPKELKRLAQQDHEGWYDFYSTSYVDEVAG